MTAATYALLLADGRFPSGSYAHSGGLEAAVEAGRVHDLASLASFSAGRLRTAGTVAAAFAAAALVAAGDATALRCLDAELDARTASPALRLASRRQGRGLVRAAAAALGFDKAAVPGTPDGPHHAVALGAVGAAAGLAAADVARIAALSSVTGPANAGVRLLGLDPLAVTGMVTSFAVDVETIVADAVAVTSIPVDPWELPCPSAPLLDVGAEHHALQEVQLFAS